MDRFGALNPFEPFRTGIADLVRPILVALSDPTDLLHYWSLRAPERKSDFLIATLRRSSDGVEADFATDAQGYLPTTEVLAWAGASAVTVARLWGLTGTQLGPELVVNGTFDANTTGWLTGSGAVISRVDAGMKVVTPDADPIAAGYQDLTSKISVGAVYQVRMIIVSFTSGKTARIGITSVPTGTYDILAFANDSIPTQQKQYIGYFIAPAGNVFIGVAPLNGLNEIVVNDISVCQVLTANAVQTTINDQPPLDLTATPLRIGASASKSLVATLPTAITGARVLTADENGVAVATADLASGAYTVQNANALRERVVLAADTPEADVDAVKRNMMRAWRLGAAA